MTISLEEAIRQKLVEYYRRGKKRIAYELGELYFRLARRRVTEEETLAACHEGFYWLKIAGCPLSTPLVNHDVLFLTEAMRKMLSTGFKRSGPV